MTQVGEGIAEAIALTLNSYDLTDEQYDSFFDGAVDVFLGYIEEHKPAQAAFDRYSASFYNCDAITEDEEQELLRGAESAADAYIEEMMEEA